jgi:hypothetical protein
LNPLDRIATLVQCTGDRRPVEWLCAQAGGCFMPNPPAKGSLPKDWLPVTGTVMQELGRLQAAIGAWLMVKQYPGPQTEGLRALWDKLKPDMERLVSGGERGLFLPVRNPFCLGRGCGGEARPA